jgi:hypothetical protein
MNNEINKEMIQNLCITKSLDELYDTIGIEILSKYLDILIANEQYNIEHLIDIFGFEAIEPFLLVE